MELGWLEDFIALADAGSFSKAAEQRNITQPAFSRRIKALEEWVGTSLVDRATHRIRLTEAGLCFQTAAAETLRHLQRGRDEALEAGAKGAAMLRFAATHALSFSFFPAWLRSVERVHDAGPIHLISDTMHACEEAMIRGQVHFLLAHSHARVASRLDPAKFVSASVGEDMLIPVAAPDLLADGQRVDLDQGSARIPYLAYSSASGLGRIVAAIHLERRQAARLEVVFTSHLAAVLRQMALAGQGVGWIPHSLIADDLASGRLVRAGGDLWNIAVDVRLFRPQARQILTAENFWSGIRQVQGAEATFSPKDHAASALR